MIPSLLAHKQQINTKKQTKQNKKTKPNNNNQKPNPKPTSKSFTQATLLGHLCKEKSN